MLPYWILFLIPALSVLAPIRLEPTLRACVVWASGVVIMLVVGLRHEVGADWLSYFRYLEISRSSSLTQLIKLGDPGYYFLNWFSARLDGGIHLVNTLCAAFTMAGVVRFSLRQPLPWLAISVAIPYLVIVVGMGYTRQATALGLVMIGLVSLSDAKVRSFVIWVLIGATFHKSAVLMLPLAVLASGQHRAKNMFLVGSVSLAGAYLFLFDSVGSLWGQYIGGEYQSQGGLVRVLMNAVPALIYLSLHKRMSLDLEERRLWWWMSTLSLICIPLVMISSTATDRMALYFIPVQIFVFSRLHTLMRDDLSRAIVVLSILGYYATVLGVWLFFAVHSDAWIPYQNIMFSSPEFGI